MNSSSFILISALFVSVSILISGSDAQSSAANVSYVSLPRLLHDLFRDYYQHVIPLSDAGPLTVEVQMNLRSLLGYNEETQEATIQAWVQMRWTDRRLMWSAEEYGNVQHFSFPSEKVWKPDITIYNHNGILENEVPDLVVINNNGKVLWYPQWTIRTTCEKQSPNITCSLKFGSWTHNGFQLDLMEVGGTGIDLQDYVTNTKLQLVETSSKRNVARYACCPEPYPDIRIKLVFQDQVTSTLRRMFQLPSWD